MLCGIIPLWFFSTWAVRLFAPGPIIADNCCYNKIEYHCNVKTRQFLFPKNHSQNAKKQDWLNEIGLRHNRNLLMNEIKFISDNLKHNLFLIVIQFW